MSFSRLNKNNLTDYGNGSLRADNALWWSVLKGLRYRRPITGLMYFHTARNDSLGGIQKTRLTIYLPLYDALGFVPSKFCFEFTTMKIR